MESAAAVDDSADFFAADVRVKATGPTGAKSREETREFRYHVERTLHGKSWKTTVAFDPEMLGPTNATRGPGDIGRIEIDEEDGTTRMYRRDGTAVPLPQVSDPLAAKAFAAYGTAKPLVSATPPVDAAGKARDRAADRAADPRAWITGLVVPGGDEQRGRRIGQLQRHFGLARGRAEQADRYVREKGARTLEVLVDRDRGLVTEVNVADSGRLVQHTQYGYRQLPGGGPWLRETARVEVAPHPGADRPTVIEHTFSNVRFERHGGSR